MGTLSLGLLLILLVALAGLKDSNCVLFGRSPSNLHFSAFRGSIHPQNTSPNADQHRNSSSHSNARGISSFFVQSARANTSPSSTSSPLAALIPTHEMEQAADKAFSIINLSPTAIKEQGWNLVHSTDIFSLYKRREKGKSGPVIYLMMGHFDDVSPRTFLFSQISQAHRKIWDTTMRSMKPLSSSCLDAACDSEDILYFKTGWPWPMKDRDYVLARRCKIFDDRNAIVFASKSMDMSKQPQEKNVIRVDNYWCHSTITARPKTISSSTSSVISSRLDSATESFYNAAGNAEDKLHTGMSFPKFSFRNPWHHLDSKNKQRKAAVIVSALDVPGMTFCTIFCDDSKVPLPPAIIDMLSKHAERLVPESIERLHGVAKLVELSNKKPDTVL